MKRKRTGTVPVLGPCAVARHMKNPDVWEQGADAVLPELDARPTATTTRRATMEADLLGSTCAGNRPADHQPLDTQRPAGLRSGPRRVGRLVDLQSARAKFGPSVHPVDAHAEAGGPRDVAAVGRQVGEVDAARVGDGPPEFGAGAGVPDTELGVAA